MKGSRIGTTTLRLPDEKIRLIRAISGYENIPLCKIFEGLTDEDIQRYRETREILEKQGFLESGLTALAEIRETGGLAVRDLNPDRIASYLLSWKTKKLGSYPSCPIAEKSAKKQDNVPRPSGARFLPHRSPNRGTGFESEAAWTGCRYDQGE